MLRHRAGSSRLRHTLYLVALVASRRDPHRKAFYRDLLTRHKAGKQALIAVARKLLHAVYGILKTNTAYDGNKLSPNKIQLKRYNRLTRGNGSGQCWEATQPRDTLAGSSQR